MEQKVSFGSVARPTFMKRRLLLILLALGCAQNEHVAPPPSATLPRAAEGGGATLVVQPTPISTTGEVSRNIFAYREPPPVVVVAQKPQPAVRVMTEAPKSIQDVMPAPQPEAPQFGYRCIGTFGTNSHRFAVFTNGEGVINAGIGDAIGTSQFVLREIGVESVTVAANTFTRRIEIGR